jgi:hypothetical protein
VANNTSGPVGWAVLLALWTICSTGAANAQAPSPRSQINNAIERPTVSPYLNLFNNNGGNPALNYYNQVRPQQQLRSTANQLQNDVRSLQTGLKNRKPVAAAGGEIPISTGRMQPTGHSTAFGSLQGYFPAATSR